MRTTSADTVSGVMNGNGVPATSVLVVGANQRSSSLTVRDRLFVDFSVMAEFLSGLRSSGIDQALVISTCERTEVCAIHGDPDSAFRRIIELMSRHGEMTPEDLKPQVYQRSGEDAVRHIFAVTASLDSLVIGEPHILGQIKASHRIARDVGMSGNELEIVLQAAYATAKRIRRETAVGSYPVSVAAALAELARGVHGDLDRCGGLLVGSGDLTEIVARTLLSSGLARLVACHPTVSRAEAAARAFECHVASFDNLMETLPASDIFVTSLGTRRHIVTRGMVKAALKARRHRPLVLVDLGIPGDIDPSVEQLDDAFLFDLDDLEQVAMKGRATRENEAASALRMLEEEVAAFLRIRAERQAVPALTGLRAYFEAARDAALADAGGDPEKATRLLVNRLLHNPSKALRDLAGQGAGGVENLRETERALNRLFGLGHGPEENE